MKIIKTHLILFLFITILQADEEKKYLNFKLPFCAFWGYNVGVEPEFEITKHISFEPSIVLNPFSFPTVNMSPFLISNPFYIYGYGLGLSTNFYLQELGSKYNQYLKIKGHSEYRAYKNYSDYYALSIILGYQVLTSRYFNLNIGLGDTLYYYSGELHQMFEFDFQLGFMF